MSTLGQGIACYVLNETAIANTTARVSSITWLQHARIASYQLITGEDAPTRFAVTAADAVVASTHTWTFANGAFTANNVGGTLTVSGAANAANNGTFTIVSVTNATTIVTGGSQTNETFTTVVSASATNNTLDGAWKVEVSNNYSGAGGSAMGQAPNTGTWTDVTASFSPAIVAVAHGTAATKNQYTQCAPLGARAARVTFTPSAGIGAVSAAIAGGNY